MIDITELHTISSLQGLPEDSLYNLAATMQHKVYAPGEFIFWEGDASLGLWFILSGRVRMVKVSENGRVQSLGINNSGECFGACPWVSSPMNPVNAQALDQVALLVLPNFEAQQLMDTDTVLAQTLYDNSCQCWGD